jgi:cell division protein FtsQ
MLKKIGSLLQKRGKKENRGQYRVDAISLHSPPGQRDRGAAGKKYSGVLRKLLQRFRVSQKKEAHYSSPVQNKKQNRRIAGIGLFLLLLVASAAYVGSGKLLGRLEKISFFSVSRIDVAESNLVSEEKIREVSGIVPFQTSLLGLDVSAVERKLLTIPWIGSVEVKKNWPATVEISIVENVPVALLHDPRAKDSELYYLDKKGNPFLAVGPASDIDFPVVTGLQDVEDPQLREAAMKEVQIFLKWIGRDHPYLPSQSVSEIHITPRAEMVVYLTEHPFPIFFGTGDTRSKYSRLVQVLKALYVKYKGTESISNIQFIQMDYLNNKVRVAESGSG